MIEPVAIECAYCRALPFWRAYAWADDALLHVAQFGHNEWVLRLSNGLTVPIGPWLPKLEG